MSTNFYWKPATPPNLATSIPADLPDGTKGFFQLVWKPADEYAYDDRMIGKRAAAGLFCWTCRISLVSGMAAEAHRNQLEVHGRGVPDHTACPKCGARHAEVKPGDTIANVPSGAAVELGFAKPTEVPRVGVAGCSSFSWKRDPEKVKAACAKFLDDAVIVDEYGTEYTGRKFLDEVIGYAPLQFTDGIGGNWD